MRFAPFLNTDRAVATAAYQPDDDAASSPLRDGNRLDRIVGTPGLPDPSCRARCDVNHNATERDRRGDPRPSRAIDGPEQHDDQRRQEEGDNDPPDNTPDHHVGSHRPAHLTRHHAPGHRAHTHHRDHAQEGNKRENGQQNQTQLSTCDCLFAMTYPAVPSFERDIRARRHQANSRGCTLCKRGSSRSCAVKCEPLPSGARVQVAEGARRGRAPGRGRARRHTGPASQAAMTPSVTDLGTVRSGGRRSGRMILRDRLRASRLPSLRSALTRP